MKQKNLFSFLLTALFCLTILPFSAAADTTTPTKNTESVSTENTLVDAGINYTEKVGTISNPGAGYTTTDWYFCAPNDTKVHSKFGNLVLMFIDIGQFSSGVNGTTDDNGNYTEGTDYDLDALFFQNVRATFENCRKNGSTIAVRFRYDSNGKENPEPATFEQVLHHIQQIKENGLLEDYKDILMFVETGFVGKWGEQHGGKYTALDYKVQLVNAMLDCVPKEIPITVRTPNIFAAWAGITTAEMADYIAEPNSDAARIGLYNDGYMGSDTDLGTYSNRAAETTWMQQQMQTTYYGGEFSGNLDWAQKYDTYLPENAIPEMYYTHLSYINANIYSLYKDYTFGESYDVENVDNSAYYGQTVFQFIRDHLGYRFVIRDAKISETVEAGKQLQCQLSIENTGFANPIRPLKAEVLLEKDGNYIQTEVNLDPTQWHSCTTTEIPLTLQLPGDLDAGKWQVYLRLSIGNQGIDESAMRTVQFANEDIWNAMLGANQIGSVTITETTKPSQLTQHNFYEITEQEISIADGTPLSYRQSILTDGQRSSNTEWTEDTQYDATETTALYITNDDQYLYVMAEMPMETVVAPVYNLQVTHADTNEKYWIYYASNGYVYFNHDSYAGSVCKHIGNCVEFKIPFSVLDLEAGTELSRIRVSIQDSSVSGWLTIADMVANRSYVVTDTFTTYNATRSVILKKGEEFSLTAYCTLPDAVYQWYHDGIEIPKATSATYCISSADTTAIGEYTVSITIPSGTQKTLSICHVTDIWSDKQMGDVNTDGTVNLLDVVLLQKYLLRKTDGTEITVEFANCYEDEKINILDLMILKKMLIKNN